MKDKQSLRKQPGWINKKELAASLGISVQAFDQWGVLPVEKIGRESFYMVSDVVRNRLDRQAKRISSQRPEPEAGAVTTEELDRAKLANLNEDTETKRLKNAQTRKELAPVSVIGWTLSKVGSQIAAILESIPMKVKKVLPKMTATEIEHIKREVVKAQNAAARVMVDLDEYYDGDLRSDQETDHAGVAHAPTA